MRTIHLLILVSIAGIGCLAGIVSANMAAPPGFMTVVHIEKNGIPDEGTLTYTLTCYGYSTDPPLESGHPGNKTENKTRNLVQVYSVSYSKYHVGNQGYWHRLSDECMVNGSTKIEQYCSTGDNFGDSAPGRSELCRLNGSTLTGTYSVWNATDKPVVKHSTGAHFPSSYYEFFFTLPSDDKNPGKGIPAHEPETGTSLVESLYCSILSIFGATC